ncbi:MAG: sigma-70 family RNA polymerase sigma factor [Phycisphaerales bacterium]
MSEQQQPSDETLLLHFTKGDRAALGQLAARYENALVGLATGLLAGRVDLAHDAVQESWIRVIRYAKSFNNQSTFKTWMFRIVINRCHDLRKTTALKPPSPASAGEGGRGFARSDEGVAQARHNQQGVLRLTTTPTHDQVATALNTLPERTRLVLLLCYHRGLTHPQAADVLDIPLGTLKSRLSAGLAELRETLQPPRESTHATTAKAAT